MHTDKVNAHKDMAAAAAVAPFALAAPAATAVEDVFWATVAGNTVAP